MNGPNVKIIETETEEIDIEGGDDDHGTPQGVPVTRGPGHGTPQVGTDPGHGTPQGS